MASIVTTATDAARRLRESSDPAAAPRTLYSHSDQVKVIALTAQWRRSRRRPAGCAHEASERGFFSVLRLEAAASSATVRSPVRRGRLSLRARSVWVRATFCGLDGFAACLVRWLFDSRGRFSRAIGSRVRRSARLFAVPVVLATSWIVLTGSARGRRFVAGGGGSIRGAVDAAEPGDSIVVRGVQRETVAISTDGVTLRAQGGLATTESRERGP